MMWFSKCVIVRFLFAIGLGCCLSAVKLFYCQTHEFGLDDVLLDCGRGLDTPVGVFDAEAPVGRHQGGRGPVEREGARSRTHQFKNGAVILAQFVSSRLEVFVSTEPPRTNAIPHAIISL